MDFINWGLAKNPINYLVVGSLALVGLAFAAVLTAPMRAASAAQ